MHSPSTRRPALDDRARHRCAGPRLRRAAAAVLLALGACVAGLGLGACADRAGDAGDRRQPAANAAGASSPSSSAAAPAVEVVAENLVVPWDLAFAPDGRIFLTERPGRIRVIREGRLLPEPWAELDVAAVGEAGLTAIALAPDFERSGAVYVLGTFRAGGGLENRIVRLREQGGRGVRPEVVVGGMPAGRIHAGGALDFGPDGMLYVTVGDASEPSLAQDPAALNGKLLRYTPDGAVPADNPRPGSPVFALGLRNVQGLDWTGDGALFASEHGPSGLPWEGGRRGRDEINRIAPGGNYGWPEVAGRGAGERFRAPLAVWTPAIAPSGLAIYTGEQLPHWRGDAFLGGLRGQQLRRVDLEPDAGGWRVAGQEALFEDEYGRIRAVVMGPDGALYFTTSNRDGRGHPAGNDDRVLRVVAR